MSVSLKARWNYVVYTGGPQYSLAALESIAPYIEPGTGFWYWNNLTYEYESMQQPGIPVYDRNIMVPYGIYSISVVQDCVWEYGPDATPPDKVTLYGGRFNGVAYSGPVQRSLDALASIAPYLAPDYGVWYWNNETYEWESMQDGSGAPYDRDIMVPNGYYQVWVTQDCVWTFEVEVPVAYCSVEVDCPATGQEGELIEARVTVTNLDPTINWIFLTQIWAGAELIAEADDLIPASTSKTYYGYFTMPGYNVTILGWVERVSSIEPYEVVFCGTDSATVVYVPPVPPEGTITRKELDYQNIWQALPVYNIPVGTRTRVRITGRNDTSINQKMGIYWFVADPEGYVVQEHYDWETFWTGPGLEQGFVGSGFDLSKVGGYTIWVELLMNPDAPQVVDRYIGDLCTVIAVVPEPEFAGFSISEYTK